MILTVTVAIAERRWKTALSPANMRIAKEPTIVKINVRRLKILSIISLTSQVKIPNRLFAFYWVYCRLRSARLYALSLVWCLAKKFRRKKVRIRTRSARCFAKWAGYVPKSRLH